MIQQSLGYSISIQEIREEARNLISKGIVSRQQPIYVLVQYIPAREWAAVETELEKHNFLLRDRLGDLLDNEWWQGEEQLVTQSSDSLKAQSSESNQSSSFDRDSSKSESHSSPNQPRLPKISRSTMHGLNASYTFTTSETREFQPYRTLPLPKIKSLDLSSDSHSEQES